MGATIDYAIVITSRYMDLRKKMTDKKQVVIEALNQAFPTVATSGTILTCAGFAVGRLTSNAIIASLGKALGAGTLVSIILVMTALPQILLVFDWLIDRTEFNRGAVKGKEEAAKGAGKAAEIAGEKKAEGKAEGEEDEDEICGKTAEKSREASEAKEEPARAVKLPEKSQKEITTAGRGR